MSKYKEKYSPNEFVISAKVHHLAQVLYDEFARVQSDYGAIAHSRLVPIVVNLLEDMNRLITENQKLDLEFNLAVAEKNDLVVQLNREKGLCKSTRERVSVLEDELSSLKLDTDKQVEELMDSLNRCQLLNRNAKEHIIRLEEREVHLRRELLDQSERYAELFKTHVEYRKLNQIPYIDKCIEPQGLSSVVTSSPPKDLDQGGMKDSLGPEIVICDRFPESYENILENELQVHAQDYNDLFDEDTLDFETVPKDSNGTDETDQNQAVSHSISGGMAMMKEVEKLIKENTELCETKNALNVLKDDLLQKVDNLTGEKMWLTQELKRVCNGRNQIYSEMVMLSRLVHKCQDQIGSLSARLKIYEDLDQTDLHDRSSQQNLTLIPRSQLFASCIDLNKMIDYQDQGNRLNKSMFVKSSNHLDVAERSVRDTVCSLSNVDQNLDTCDADVSEDVNNEKLIYSSMKCAKLADCCFTKREMARVIAERNSYKQKYLELNEVLLLRNLSIPVRHHRHGTSTSGSMGQVRNKTYSNSLFSAIHAITDDITTSFAELFLSVTDDPVIAAPLCEPEHDSVDVIPDSSDPVKLLKLMFSRLLGYAVTYTADGSVGNSNDYITEIGSHSL